MSDAQGKPVILKAVDCCATCDRFRGMFDSGWCVLLENLDDEDCFVQCYNVCDKFKARAK